MLADSRMGPVRRRIRYMPADLAPCGRVLLLAVMAVALLAAAAAAAPDGLRGTVVSAETREPVAEVRVVLDSLTLRITLRDGSFDFGAIDSTEHVLVFEHISFQRRVIRFHWPDEPPPLVVEMQPTQFEVPPVQVTAERPVPSLPVSSVSFSREDNFLMPGNIANDPLRTVQSHPSAATAGIDFLSALAVRGGDTEELRVYFDEFPLRHYSHLGGFSSVIYDDMLASTILVPGAAPIRYKGALSGVVMMVPENPDTSSASLRYDITSIAGGISRVVSPSLTVQASAKSDFFNLPVYQQVGVDERSFKDLMARAIVTPREWLTLTPTLLLARDSEIGSETQGVSQQRKTSSALAGIDVKMRRSEWDVTLRPWYSYFRSSDALTWSTDPREHRLNEGHIFGELSRQEPSIGLSLSGEAGVVDHDGYGGSLHSTPWSASSEVRLMYRDAVALVVGGGGTREEWTSKTEGEGYASLRVSPLEHLSFSGAVRRSHQTPFVFSERRYFASIPIDAGDLSLGFPPGRDVLAVRTDQASVGAHLDLPLLLSIEGNGYWREYDHLPSWSWIAFPTPLDVANGGSGHGDGYEIIFARRDPDRFSFSMSASRARIWKTEGTLTGERIGDFDKPDAYQVIGEVRVSEGTRISVRWTDVAGLPYTPYDHQTTPPPDDQVNAARLDRFRRLDVKVTFDAKSESFDATIFIDIINLLDRRNVATTYALELNPGEFTTAPYGGTRFFPIGGITVRW